MAGGLHVILQVEDHRHFQFPGKTEKTDAVRTVVHGATFEFTADFCPVDPVSRFQFLTGIRIQRVRAISQNKAFRGPFHIGNTAAERNGAGLGTQHICRDHMGVTVVIIALAAFPAEDPGLFDIVFIHVGQEFIQIMSVPVRMIVNVDDLHKNCSCFFPFREFFR